ncbi:MAG: 2-C-methyl-D-erythritol 2,4-cyclodiphosphate synthase [Actinobacteria bacterium]|nr:2-C-methyl-D-erythritol 2,4-cyclodiphosphate synthase [Actinomycetota bacterium]MBU1494107.1 2-C-methyl-D-erythritol 2,4-cyclodiphosphate synthase [Actinomycetota bacterium]MBU1865128.1 2-C-methyl-D-erythritol 2,4-cyclodiphosphate synthase [Actinomycetota bacterium]
MTTRVGWGFDAHRFSTTGTVLLAGIMADSSRGITATSDGDVPAHAVADALLGAAALGDLGTLFPSSDPAWAGADSMALLDDVVGRVIAAGYRVASLDLTIIAETVRVAPFREAIREALAGRLGVDFAAVSVKATTTDGMGFLGADEGLAAVAVAVLEG